MHRKLLIQLNYHTLLFLFSFLFLTFQNSAQNLKTNPDNVRVGLYPELFKKIYNKQFSNLLTSQSKTFIGNFVSLDLKETSVAFNGNSVFKDGSVLGFKVSGAVSDGIYNVFNNSSLNAQVSIDLQYNFLAIKKKMLAFNRQSYIDYNEKADQIHIDSTTKALLLQNDLGKRLLELNARNIDSSIYWLQLKINNMPTSDSIYVLRRDSLGYELSKLKLTQATLAAKLDNYPGPYTLKNELGNWTGKELSKLPEIEVRGFLYKWFSISYKVNNNNFKQLNDLSGTVSDRHFTTHEIRIQYSKYKWSSASMESYFWIIGIAPARVDNFNDLTKNDMEERKELGSTPGERTLLKTYTAYSMPYVRDLKSLRIYAEYYKFLFRKNTGAIHIFPEEKIRQELHPITNLGTGFVYSFKDTKDETTIVNAEVFYQFQDIFHNTESTYRLWERNAIGINFTFPLKFKTL